MKPKIVTQWVYAEFSDEEWRYYYYRVTKFDNDEIMSEPISLKVYIKELEF